MIDPRFIPETVGERRLLALIRQRGLTLTVLHGRMIRVTGPGVHITAEGLGPLNEADLTPIRSDSDALRLRRRSS